MFGRSTVMMASLNTVHVCVCTSPCRLGCTTYFVGDQFIETPGNFHDHPRPNSSKFYNQCRVSGSDRKFKAAMEGVKFTTGFWRYRPKRLVFEVASRKSRTLGVDQKFLIVKTKDVVFLSGPLFWLMVNPSQNTYIQRSRLGF